MNHRHHLKSNLKFLNSEKLKPLTKHYNRLKQISKPNLFRILVILLFLGLAAWGLYLDSFYGNSSWIITNNNLSKFLARTLITLGPELAGIVIGVVTIDYLNERRQDAQLLKQLVIQMQSSHNDVADTAIRTLKAYEWLMDGSLKGINLREANLVGADLKGAVLEGSDLYKANLENAALVSANLKNTFLVKANFKNARLLYANLKGARLMNADLREADLRSAILEEANMREVILERAKLSGNLKRAKLGGAKLQRADLSNAKLQHAYLRHANLAGANMWEAILRGADLSFANLEGAKNCLRIQLLQAKSLKGATMPNGMKFEEWNSKESEDQIDSRARAEIDRIMQVYTFEEE